MNNENVMTAMIDDVDELYHHGVKGMKWGVRRTPAQLGHKPPSKKRIKRAKDYVNNLIKQHKNNRKVEKEAKKIDKAAKKAEAEERKKAATLGKKSVSDMDDDELAAYITRKNAERMALTLDRDINALNPPKVSAGQKFANEFKERALGPAAMEAGKKLMSSVLNKAVEKALGGGADDALGKLKKEAEAAGYGKIKSEAKKAAIEAMEKEYNFKQRVERDRAKAEESKASAKSSNDSSKVYEGTVEWSDFKKTTSSQQKAGKTVVDAESWSTTPASSTSSSTRQLGQSYIAGLLPAPKDDD